MSTQTKPLRWVSWAAVSSQPQAAPDKVSIPLQQAANRLHAERHAGEMVAELVVPGESRSIATWEEACQRIDAYAQLRDLLSRKAFDVLVYYDASRLARTLSLGATIRELCIRAGVILYETTNPPNELRAGWRHDSALIGAIKAVESQQEVAKLVERRAAGMVGRTLRGEFQAQPNFGYTYQYTADGKREVVIDDSAAATVRLLFRLYLDGFGLQAIADALNAGSHAPPAAEVWTGNNVHNIVDRAHIYAGFTVLNAKSRKGADVVRARGNWEPLLAPEDYEAVQLEREQRANNRRLPDFAMRLSSVCHCAECGGAMHYRRAFPEHIPRLKEPLAYLRCTRHRPSISLLESTIIERLEAEIDALHGIDLDNLAMMDADPLADLRAQMTDAEAQQDRLAAALRRADDAYIGGLMDDERYRDQVQKIRAQAQQAEQELAKLRAKLADSVAAGTRRQRLEDARDYGRVFLHSDDVAASNRWLRRHVRVYVGGEPYHAEVQAVVWL